MAQAKLRRKAQKKGHSLKPETLEYAKYVIVFTTFPEESFNDIDVLDMIAGWKDISKFLTERHRCRNSQLSKYLQY